MFENMEILRGDTKYGNYILQFLLSPRRSQKSVECNEYGGHTPSDGVEDGHDLGLSDERDDEQCVQVQALAKHPEVRGHQEVLYQDMQDLALDLKTAKFKGFHR